MGYQSVILEERNYGGLPWAYWPLEEANGTAAADLMAAAQQGYGGTLHGGVSLDQRPGPIAREPGGGMSFDGSTGYSSHGTLGNLGSLLAGGLTFECWLRTTAKRQCSFAGNYSGNIGQTAFQVQMNRWSDTNGIGNLQFLVNDNTGNGYVQRYTTAGGCNDGGWHHVACSFTWPSWQAIYIDGAAKTLGTDYNHPLSSAANFRYDTRLGLTVLGSAAAVTLSHVAIYNYALAADRVLAHYLAGLNGTPHIRLLG